MKKEKMTKSIHMYNYITISVVSYQKLLKIIQVSKMSTSVSSILFSINSCRANGSYP